MQLQLKELELRKITPSPSNSPLSTIVHSLMWVNRYDWFHSCTKKRWTSFSYTLKRCYHPPLAIRGPHNVATECACGQSTWSIRVDCEVVKREAYKLVPEAYCQQFREIICFIWNLPGRRRYCLTGGVLHNKLEKFEQLILFLEEFKKCVPTTIKLT